MAMIFTLQMDSSPGWRTHVGVFEGERFLLLWTESCNPHALATIHILKAWIPSVTAFRDRTWGDNWGCVVLSHFSHVQLFATPWATASQASLSMGILQERTLKWVDMKILQGIFPTRDWTLVSHIAGGFFTVWPPREALIKVKWGQEGRLVDTVWEEEGGINWESSMKTYIQFISVAQSCPTLWCHGLLPGFPVHHQLLEIIQLMSIVLVMPSNFLILCHPFLLPPSIFPSIRVFSNESVLHIRWTKYWSFSFSTSPSNEY